MATFSTALTCIKSGATSGQLWAAKEGHGLSTQGDYK